MDINQVKILIEKYHNCETSVEEEFKLVEYFSRENVPEELAAQKQYFQFIDQEKKVEILNPDFEKELIDLLNEKKSFFQLYKVPISIAASIILLIGVFMLIPKDCKVNKNYFAGIEDTYGDPHEAYLEAKRALTFVAEKFETGTKELANISTIDKGIQYLNNLKKVDNAISQYGKIASLNKLDQFFLSF